MQSVACKVYKIFNGLSSPLLCQLIKKSASRSTRNEFKIELPSFKYVDHLIIELPLFGATFQTRLETRNPTLLLKMH